MDFSENEFDFENRILSARETDGDAEPDITLRPKTLEDYIGQEGIKENRKVYMGAAKQRRDALDHVPLF